MWSEKYKKVYTERIIARCEKKLSKGYIKSAIACYEGFMKHCPMCPDTQDRLAQLYVETGDKIRAGRYFYFKENTTESEAACIRLFEASLGKDPVLILRRLRNKEHQPVSTLEAYTKQRLNDLIKNIIEQKGYVPVFAQGMKRHFDKIGLK